MNLKLKKKKKSFDNTPHHTPTYFIKHNISIDNDVTRRVVHPARTRIADFLLAFSSENDCYSRANVSDSTPPYKNITAPRRLASYDPAAGSCRRARSHVVAATGTTIASETVFEFFRPRDIVFIRFHSRSVQVRYLTGGGDPERFFTAAFSDPRLFRGRDAAVRPRR